MKLLRVAFKYLKAHSLLAWTTFLFMAASSLFEGASFGMLIPLLQGMTNNSSNVLSRVPFLRESGILQDRTALISLIFVILFTVLVIKNIFLYISSILIARLRFGTSRDVSVELMNHLIDYDIAYFDKTNSGYLISTITNETRRMGDFVYSALNFMTTLLKVLSYATVLFLISWKMSGILLILFAIVLVPLEIIMKRLKHLGARISKVYSDFNMKLTEIIGGIRLIKGSGTEVIEKAGFSGIAGKLFDLQYSINRYTNLLIPLSEVSIFGLIMICFLVMVRTIKIDVTYAFPYIATYLVVLVKALTQLNMMNTMRSNALSNLAAFSSYELLCDERGKKTLVDGSHMPSRFSGAIEFKQVSFSYTEGSSVLRDVDLKIPCGKITAIVGMSGAGKSTLVNLIMRYYDVNRGAILVDGLDVRMLNMREWRRKIGLVSQDIFIFNDSTKANIAYGRNDLSQKDIVKAATVAGADEFIRQMPDGYDTVLGERGVKLSGGQRQRISIARAIIHNPEILILDEATSSLDSKTEKLIQDAVDELTKDRTVIAIAHRLSTIVNADTIVVLDNGKVTESGTHAALMERGGLYKRLYQTQFKEQM